MKKPNIPTVFLIFGATGDLMAKKLVPALFHLYRKRKLPVLIKIIGFSRRGFDDDQFQQFVLDILKNHKDIKKYPHEFDAFLKHFMYFKGDFEEETDYHTLAEKLGRIDGEWKVCSNKLFYLSVPPQFYKTILTHLASSGLTIPCSPEEGFTRVLVEKPFGHNLKTAEELDALLGKLFKEEQVYRIDHYLAKEILQNIINFRFSNNLFETSWNVSFLEKIHIRILEKIGVDGRGKFYDGLGALRDVGQNHLLQMLALVTMDLPNTLDGESVRKKRAEALQGLTPIVAETVSENTFRAQYEGYRETQGVAKHSQTETYFKIRTTLSSSRYKNVPVILESGKRLKKSIKEIEITFQHPTPCLCPPGVHYKNRLVISLEPIEAISIYFWSKRPGNESGLEERRLNFLYRARRKKSQYVEEYEKLLQDCILGNQMLFLSTDEVQTTWKFIDPILSSWEKNMVSLKTYKPDTDQPVRASRYIDAGFVKPNFKKELAIAGLGKMGANVARRLSEKGWKVFGYNRSPEKTEALVEDGIHAVFSVSELVKALPKPRIFFLMLPQNTVDEFLFGNSGLVQYLDKGDIIVEAGNSFYKDSIRRENELRKTGVRFVDVGVSGGPGGARSGACLMVGGTRLLFDYLYPLFSDLSIPGGLEFFPGTGAGHFVKMVHNGIEYGMMQAVAEGFAILKESDYHLDLTRVASVYNNGSVIESRLIGWLRNAFELGGEDLKNITGVVGHTGEGAWTVETAGRLGLKAKVIEDALQFRIESEKNPSYAGKILSALRNQFGGHKAGKD